MADQLARIRAAVLARPHLDHGEFVLAVKTFCWPSDAARGCLLGLVRVAWGEPMAYVEPHAGFGFFVACKADGAALGSGRTCRHRVPQDDVSGPNEEEALVAALEASPTEAP